MKRHIRKKAFLMITRGGLLDDIGQSIKDFDLDKFVNKITSYFKDDPKKQEEAKKTVQEAAKKENSQPKKPTAPKKEEIKKEDETKEEDFLDKLKNIIWHEEDTSSKDSSLGEKVLHNAISDMGIKETSDNYGPEIVDYFKNIGITLPKSGLSWCAAAASTWLLSAGVPINGSAGSRMLGEQFKQKGKWVDYKNIVKEKHLKPGNVAVWSRTADGIHGHTGIIESYSGDSLTTIDGNTGPTGASVARVTRPLGGSGELKLLGIGLVSEM